MLEKELETIKKEGKLRKEQREQIEKRIKERKGGRKKKFRLGKASIKYVMPIWNEKNKYNQRPAYLIQLTEDYLEQKVKEEIVEKELEQYCEEDLERFINLEEERKYSYIARAAALICYESLTKENASNSKIRYWIKNSLEYAILLECQEELWDSAALIGLAMEKEEKEYWLWYIEKVKELLEEKEEDSTIFAETEAKIFDLTNKNKEKEEENFLKDFPMNPPI